MEEEFRNAAAARRGQEAGRRHQVVAAAKGCTGNSTQGKFMAIMDFIKKQFIDIIQWTDDSRDTLSYRFPDEDKEIKNGAQLIVRESQAAQFIYLGQFGDTFGPGKHALTTDNIPVLTNLKSWKYALESPFKADVYYVVTRLFTGNKWGTSNPVMMRDADFGIVRLRAYGTYDFRIVDVKKFLKEVAGTDDHFRLDEFNDTMRSRIVSVFSEALASSKIPALDVAARYARVGRRAAAAHQSGDRRKIRPGNDDIPGRERLGPAGSGAGHRQALEHGGGRQSQRLRQVPDGAGPWATWWRRRHRRRRRGARDGHGDGAADDEPDRRPDGAGHARHSRAGRAAPAPGAPDLMTPAQVAQMLGVAESDVMSSLDAGDLKGRKIGTQWRVTRAAVDAFLKG